jgi:hypothetical protein
MLRTLLLGILAVSAVASCGSKEAAPAATPGAPAGKVLELTGTVTATRGSEVRTLSPGGEISADDVIDTANESRVVILVAHNNARWDLGPNRKSKVGESQAWTAAKQVGPAAVVKEETSTAGRHAEKTAATTTTTTGAADEPNVQPAPGGSAVASIAPTEAPTAGGRAEPRKMADLKPRPPAKMAGPGASLPPPPPPPADSAAAFGGDKETVADTGNQAKQPTESARKVEPDDDDGPDLRTKGTETKPAVRGGSVGTLGAARPDSPLELEVRATLTKQNAALQVCLGTDLTRLALRVSVTDGVFTILTDDAKATAATRTCLAKVAKTLKATTKGRASVPHSITK